jgi:hypothetical protein
MTELEQFEDLKGQLLAVDAQLVECERRFFVLGDVTPLAVRVDLEAQAAQLRVRIHAARRAVRAAHEKAREAKGQCFLRLLINECNRAGQGHLVDAANKESRAYIDGSPMAAAYAARV